MRTSNPVLNSSVFNIQDSTATTTMTLQGTVVKTAVLLGILIVGAGYTWYQTAQVLGGEVADGVSGAAYNYAMIGAIAGLVLALITSFKPSWSPYTAPPYALAEGLFLGGISAIFNYAYPGIVPEAVALTFGTLAALLTAYATRIIRVTEKLKLGIFAATGAIALFYLVSMVLGFFGVRVPMIWDNGLVGIGFSLFVVVIAALNLVLDFDFIEKGCEQQAPKYMEWYGAFGLLVTLVWLYLEILRLLSKLRSRD
ncbi:MAG: Bax inhibitor-1/YccA family protein [Planctomycetia bacterium]|nr:Bax inhibitor-1/YccA family protein [Planctomycetia bacterium]